MADYTGVDTYVGGGGVPAPAPAPAPGPGSVYDGGGSFQPVPEPTPAPAPAPYDPILPTAPAAPGGTVGIEPTFGTGTPSLETTASSSSTTETSSSGTSSSGTTGGTIDAEPSVAGGTTPIGPGGLYFAPRLVGVGPESPYLRQLADRRPLAPLRDERAVAMVAPGTAESAAGPVPSASASSGSRWAWWLALAFTLYMVAR